MAFSRIVVGIDGSEHATRALAAAAELASASGGTIHLVCGVHYPSAHEVAETIRQMPEEFRNSYDAMATERDALAAAGQLPRRPRHRPRRRSRRRTPGRGHHGRGRTARRRSGRGRQPGTRTGDPAVARQRLASCRQPRRPQRADRQVAHSVARWRPQRRRNGSSPGWRSSWARFQVAKAPRMCGGSPWISVKQPLTERVSK